MAKSQWYEKLKIGLRNNLNSYRVLHKYNKVLFFVIIISFFSIILSTILLPFLFKLILELLTQSCYEHFFNIFVFITIAYYIIAFSLDKFFREIRLIIYKIWGKYLRHYMQTKLIKKFQAFTFNTFETKEFQDKIYNIIEGSEYVPISLVSSSFDKLISITSLASSFLILSIKNFYIAIITFICFSIVIWTALKLRNAYIEICNNQITCTREISYCFNIMASKGYKKELDLFNMYDFWNNRLNRNFDENLNSWIIFLKKEIKLNFLSDIFVGSCLLGVITWFAIQSIYYNISIADFVFYFNLLFSIKVSYELLTDSITKNYGNELFMNNYLGILNWKEKTMGNKILSNNKKHTLEFKNVYFKYSKNENYVLNNISFKAEFNEKICIVGENGCGKTTLINLILKVYKPTYGEIFLDNININDYNDAEYFKNLGIITQDFNKYAMSINEYVSCGKISKTNKDKKNIQRIINISKVCGINRFINKPELYDLNLLKIFDEKSLELSSGQWQKLAIARALFNNSPILILDEPTSALDPKSADFIYNYILSLKNKLIFFISHKPENFDKASKVLFLNNGKTSGFSTHQDLLENNSLYKEFLGHIPKKVR